MNSFPDFDRGDEGQGTGLPLMVRFLATGAFSGYIPWAPGTFGALVGLLVLVLLPVSAPGWVPLALILAGLPAGAYCAGRVAAVVGHRLSRAAALTKSALGQDRHGPAHADPSIVVIDEIVGMWVTMLYLPTTPFAFAVGFVVFRSMDILKPEPARLLERLPGGWGIMLDDVMAGVYANMLTRAVIALAAIIM